MTTCNWSIRPETRFQFTHLIGIAGTTLDQCGHGLMVRNATGQNELLQIR